MYPRIAFIVVAFFWGVLCQAQTTISGSLKEGEGRVVSLYLMDDFVTESLVLIDESEVDEQGNFSLHASFDEVRYAVLKVGYYASGIYLEPGKHYQLVCEYEPVAAHVNPNLMDTPLYYVIKNEVFDGLNSQISTFNKMYDDFIIAHQQTLFRAKNRGLIEAFRHAVEKQFAGYDDPYFEDYVAYRFAALALQTRTLSRAQLAHRYLTGRPPYGHDEAMAFFNLFFDKYVQTQSKAIDRRDLQATINYQVSYTALLDTLGKDTILKNEAMRELVMLLTLKSLLGSNDYGADQVLHLIRHIKDHSKFREHRKIAAHILDRSMMLLPGTMAPSLVVHGKDVLLSEDQRSTLLCFFQTHSGVCQAESVLLEDICRDFGEEVRVVMVCADAEEQTWNDWSQTHADACWESVWVGHNYTLLEDYRVKAYPLYVLVNPDLTLRRWDLSRPSEGLAHQLERLLSKK
ncbi:MAG: hypothetical protein CSA04_05090 [Bacteroidetes bacterium]|nr:MAG: hypothetical protein CSA04_05090 [Bacteroidota bacterium]